MKLSHQRLWGSFILMAAAVATQSVKAEEETSPHSVSGNVGLYSDYVFRGVSQTAGKPALQGGFDYTHASGLYLGTWASNVTEAMYTDADGNSSNLEWDFYGGYVGKISDDLSYNVGLLEYYYPGATHFDTLEAYAGVTWAWFGLKASYNLDDYFGAADSKGTMYWDASFNYELPASVMLGLHYGMTTAKGSAVDYNDWKIGLSKAFGGFNIGLAYTGTDLSDAEQGQIKGEDVKAGRLIGSVSKTF